MRPRPPSARYGKVWLLQGRRGLDAELLGRDVEQERCIRFEAIEVLGMVVRQQLSRLSACAAAALVVRNDHGRNFMADDFQRHARFTGSAPSHAFVSASWEPTVSSRRLFRTL